MNVAKELAALERMTVGELAFAVLRSQFGAFLEHEPGARLGEDPEEIHDMRVATRRLRATLEIFEPCFPAKAYGQALTEVKRLADALGERRDRDVAIAALHNFNDQMAAPDRRGVASLIEQLRGEQQRANEDLAPLVSEDNLKALRESMDELVRGAAAAAA